MYWRKLLNWRALLIYSHRWLGIVLGLLFTVWFVSGVAFMYWGMPRLDPGERLDRQAVIDLHLAAVSPAEAAQRHKISATGLDIAMRGDRPIYRFGQDAVYADTGERVKVTPTGPNDAVRIIREWLPEHADTVRYDRYLEDSDQWTLQSAQRRHMPVHRIAVGDERDTRYYVAEGSGELIMKTDRAGRIKGFVSGVLHWVYFTPLRRHGPLWNQFIIWSSFAGALMCVLGIVIGIWRFSMSARFGRRKGTPSRSPYAGLMRWHHYFGLGFGVIAFTWVLSGAFSLNPYGMFSGSGLDRAQRDIISGGAFDISDLSLQALQAASAALTEATGAKEMSLRQFQGALYLTGTRPASRINPASDAGSERRARQMVALAAPQRGVFDSFDTGAMEDIADRIMNPDIPVRDRTWLHEYDNYYRSRDGTRPLPVLRVRYEDDQATWLYLVPQTGDVLLQHRRSRAQRWLYSALHNLDFPYLYNRRPLWDIVVIALSIGGVVASATTLWPSVKRLARHMRRLFRRVRRILTPRTLATD